MKGIISLLVAIFSGIFGLQAQQLPAAGDTSYCLAPEYFNIAPPVFTKTYMGIASFYSAHLDGTKTATGEIFRNSKLTAASNHMPLNTWVRVTNLNNGNSVIVRINDRMHPRMKKKGRVVDLSRAAAKALDFMKRGLTKVKVEEVPAGTVD